MMILRASVATAALLACSALSPASAEVFNRVATFHVADNRSADADPEAETVAEIIAATADAMTLVYTDSPGEQVGLIDITDPATPKPAGTVDLGGEPTSVVVAADKALVGVVTSESYDKPSGYLAIVDLPSKAVVGKCDLGGQPDSLAKSPDGAYVAIAIENERDEDKGDGGLPQLPGGNLTYFKVTEDGMVDCTTMKAVDLAGVAEIGSEDPEPEYVDINSRNQAVVSLQENNHIVVVDLASGKITSSFSAGAVDLDMIDTIEEDAIHLDSSLSGVVREPDAIQWIGDDRILTANEGDWNGGSRGFTIFSIDGDVLYDSGNAVEHTAARLGHYPEGRSENKGSEPEGAEVGIYGDDTLIFVGLERASLVLVYRDAEGGPEFLQALPGGIGPEGLLALPERNLFVAAAETDLGPDGGIGSVVTIYRYEDAEPAYPQLVSADGSNGAPIPWMAISGAVADPEKPGTLYAVTDSASSVARILTIDATQTPAVIVAETTLTKDGAPVLALDPEGIAFADGGFWIASEGNPERDENKTNSQLVRVTATGNVEEIVDLPDDLLAHAKRFGFEGVTTTGSGEDETVWIAVQREWKDDPKGLAKILGYKPTTKTWSAVHYPLETPEAGWVGLSELTAVGDNGFLIVERDNQIGPKAKIKQLAYISLSDVTPGKLGGSLPVVEKVVVRDLIPDLLSPNGFVMDKIESFAIDVDGNAFIITDNDGVDDHSGETVFINLGKIDLPM